MFLMKHPRAIFSTVLIIIAVAAIFSYLKNYGSLSSVLSRYQTGGAKDLKTRRLPSPLSQVRETELEEVTLRVPEKWRSSEFGIGRKLQIPQGWTANVFVSGTPGARFFAIRDDGVLFLSLSKEGKVIALPDANGDGVADRIVTVLSGLDYPHGLAFHGSWLYVAETTRVMRYRDLNGDYHPDLTQSVIVNLPQGGNHISRTIAFGPDDKLYVSVGSSCNACVDDSRRAAILRYTSDGEKEEVFASGLRNAVGIVFHPETGELYATDNGRDFLGDNEPPEEVNIVKEGKNYGWPGCYGDRRPDPDLKSSQEFCDSTEPPYLKMQAHSAPLGLRFLVEKNIPPEYKGSLLMAYHGSWNRSDKTGYKIVRARVAPTGEIVIDDFAVGWKREGEVWGRPVDIIVGARGAVYVSDDKAGAVYRFAPPR